MIRISDPTYEEVSGCLLAARAEKVRSMREFAEAELVIPEGPYPGQRFRAHRLPWQGLWLDAVDSGHYTRVATTGCVQAGKTLIGFVLPVMYHLFELQETVIVGLPQMEMAADKWREELQPAIWRSRFRELLPIRGRGSRGGQSESITFRNGATLKWMTPGALIAGFTARVIVATETDKMDVAGVESREADPISRLEARSYAYDAPDRRLYLECTTSIERGRIWQEYTGGTASRIVVPCPNCRRWVLPEREDLHGWQEADNKIAARRESEFACPQCGVVFSEDDRRQSNRQAKLVHRGQTITADGTIEGEPPATDTLGFRFSAFHNLFWSAGTIGGMEWSASRDPDDENAKKEMLQFIWTQPYEPPLWDSTPLDAAVIRRRFGEWPKAVVPSEAEWMTMGLDLGKRIGWWILIAWLPGGSGHIVDYGAFDVPSDDLGLERGILQALRDFRERVEVGWGLQAGGTRGVDEVWIDAGYFGEVVDEFVKESGHPYRAVVGCGAGQQHPQHYNRPKRTGAIVKYIGTEYHVVWVPDKGVFRIEVNSDHWKSSLHERLATPIDQPGAMSIYRAMKNAHISLARHFTAERIEEEWVPGKGIIQRWIRESRANHWFDGGYLACAAGHLCGVRIVKGEEPVAVGGPPPPLLSNPVCRPDGRPFVAVRE